MPTRLLRDWTDSFAVDELDAQAERFFVRLIMVVDDYGRFHADPRMLRSKCFPLKTDIRDTDITRWMAACQKSGLVRCYTDKANRALLEICNFKQRSRTESKFAAPDICPSNDRQMTALGEGEGEGVFGDEDEGGDGCADVVALWNSRNELPSVRSVTNGRRKHINARLSEPFFRDNWQVAIHRLLQSPFLTGTNDRGWRADFDWFMKPDSVPRIMEGKYDSKAPAKTYSHANGYNESTNIDHL